MPWTNRADSRISPIALTKRLLRIRSIIWLGGIRSPDRRFIARQNNWELIRFSSGS